MTPMRQISIGIRFQAVFILAMAVLWWLSLLFHDAILGYPNFIWLGIGYFFPFVMVAFAVVLLISYKRTRYLYKWWVRLAILGAASPWIALLIGLVCSV